MKKNFFLVFFPLFLVFSCTHQQGASHYNGIVTVKPGYFCQVEAIAVNGDIVVLAGSYIPEENPNLNIQPVFSYLVALNQQHNIVWQQTPAEADYTRWKHLEIANGQVTVSGIRESPIEGFGLVYKTLSLADGTILRQTSTNKATLPRILATTYKNKFWAHLMETNQNTANLVELAIEPLNSETANRPNTNLLSYTGKIHFAAFTNNTLNGIIATGNERETTEIHFFELVTGVLLRALKLDLNGGTINDAALAPNGYTWATTAQNTQGPCLWQLQLPDTVYHTTCLDYWPFHANTKLLPYNGYTILAFNAANDTNNVYTQVVILDGQMKTVWQKAIANPHPFIIKSMMAQGQQLYITGTLETTGQGSSIAYTAIPLPALQ